MSSEIDVLRYALLGPFLRRALGPNDLSYNQTSGLGGLLFGLGLAMVGETAAVHLLLAPSHPRVAWILTALSVYGVSWLVAVHQGARLLPMEIGDDELRVRVSFLWRVDVPWRAIRSITPVTEMPRDRSVLRAALGTSPELLLTLTAPLEAIGPLGRKKSIRAIAVHVDEPARLLRAFSNASGARSIPA